MDVEFREISSNDERIAKANELFGPVWRSLGALEHKEGKPVCFWCDNEIKDQAFVCIWGNILMVPACAEHHALWHGKYADTI